MSRDYWHAEKNNGAEWRVLDENRLTVAYCGDRQNDAETIARDHNGPIGRTLAILERITACDLSHVSRDHNAELLAILADAHDLVCELECEQQAETREETEV